MIILEEGVDVAIKKNKTMEPDYGRRLKFYC